MQKDKPPFVQRLRREDVQIKEGKAHVEIRYCVTCGYYGMANWIANELWLEGKEQLAIQLTPSGDGVLEILVNGEKMFDRKAEGNKFPDLSRIWKIKDEVAMKIEEAKMAERAAREVARAAAQAAKAAAAQPSA